MAKFRVRVNNKGKRWQKGHSSSSNPATNLHRRSAQDRFFQVNVGESNLTKEAVEKHDAFTGTKSEGTASMDMEDGSGGTVISGWAGSSAKTATTFKTFNTFASDWSMCSNKSFSKLLNNFRSDSAMHKEMLAVLAAVAAVIKANGGQETSTEYFATLMTSLESSDNDDSSILAVLNLLGMGIKSVPRSVLQLKFGLVTKVFMDLLVKYAQSDHVNILRPLLGCLSVVLRAQEAAVWNEPSTLNVLDSMLTFVSFSKPKMRKAAQHAVTVVVRGGHATPAAIGHVGRHLVTLIDEALTGGGGSGGAPLTTALHALTLLKDVMIAFPKKELKICIEAVFKLMTLNNVLVTCCCLRALHGMLGGGGGGSDRPSPTSLPPATNARVISALFDFQPPATDVQPTQAWLAVLQEGYTNLARNDLGLCMANIGRLFTVVTEVYLSERSDSMSAATGVLNAAIADCLGSAAATRQLAAQHAPHISNVVNTLQFRLASFQYHAAWTHILHLIAALFRVCGEHGSKTVLPLVRQLGELRDSNQFAYISELENAVGSAIRSMGPQPVLQAIPFQVNVKDKKRDFKRSWLLPVLKDNIRMSTLNFFIEHFLPLATTCRQEADRLKGENDQVGALSYDLLQAQIWALLPSFAKQTTDIATSFPVIAKALGSVLSVRKELRMSVMSCLRRLVNQCMADDRTEDRTTIAGYAKNYLPILFNIYTTPTKATDEEGTRLASYETIKDYLKVAEPSLCCELFERAFKKMEDLEKEAAGDGKGGEIEKTPKESVLDLIRALLRYQSSATLLTTFEMVKVKITQTDNTKEQKKYYRMLEEIIKSDSSGSREFVFQNLDSIKELLINSMLKTAVSSKAARLSCLTEVVSWSDNADGDHSFERSILPEVILCLREVNKKCRSIAYHLLTLCADAIEPGEFSTLLLAGLTGNQQTMSCSLLGLASTVNHYRERLPVEIEENILYNVGVLTLCSSREVVDSALSFIKVYIQAFDRDKVAKRVPQLIQMLCKMNEDCKRHLRTKIRDIVSKLVRWYGGESIGRLIPAEDNVLKVRVRNITKIQNRRQRQRQEQREVAKKEEEDHQVYNIKGQSKSIEEILAESDSDMEYLDEHDEHKTPSDKRGRKKGRKTWITETSDEIVDFTHTGATKKITMSDSAQNQLPGSIGAKDKKKANKDGGFKTAPDGRLIIADGDKNDNSDDDIGGPKTKRRKPVIPGLSESDEDYNTVSDTESVDAAERKLNKRKRTLSTSTSQTSGPPPMKYQAGGSGIHRPLGKVSKKGVKKPADSGAVYRSKKAKGDMKRKGLPDPYAYIPLKKDHLNKRKKMKNAGQFKRLVKSAQKGAAAGAKRRHKV